MLKGLLINSEIKHVRLPLKSNECAIKNFPCTTKKFAKEKYKGNKGDLKKKLCIYFLV